MTQERTPQRTARSAQAAAEEFRLLVEGVKDYAIFLLDRDGHVMTWNAGAERIKQYAADEILGQRFSRFYEPEDQAAGRPARALEAAARDGRFEGYGWRVRKDGSRFFAHATITALYDERGELHGFAKVTQDVTAQREAERLLREREQQLAEAHAQAELSRRLQSGLLPVLSLRDSTLVLRTRYLPDHERALLGADFFDALELPDGMVATLIGDVAGHGPGEAAVGAALRAAWRALTLAGHRWGDVLDGLDKVLVSNRPSEEMFATVCCLWVSADRRQAAGRAGERGQPARRVARRGPQGQRPGLVGRHGDAVPRDLGAARIGERTGAMTGRRSRDPEAPDAVQRLDLSPDAPSATLGDRRPVGGAVSTPLTWSPWYAQEPSSATASWPSAPNRP